MNRFILLVILLAAPLMAPASPQQALFQLIDARLQLMQQVAAWKWQHKQAIENTAREKVVLDSAGMNALRFGLRLPESRAFFQAQIDAAKEIEAYWFARYKAGATPGDAVDLQQVIRPKLLMLGEQITRQLGALPSAVDDAQQSRFLASVKVEGLSKETRLALFRSLTQVGHYANRLQQVLQSGELRIGTTGDYAPFSVAANESFKGIDIDMAKDLAQAMGVNVVFVKTSWPTLMKDLAAGRFDIGMSGISRNTERAKTAYFSAPYYSGGKAAIARCTDIAKFANLADIDKPGVRIIVNPGGTNQKFVANHIKKAQVITFADNTRIFDEIVAGHADVMITDAIEVKLQALRHKSLCRAMPGKTLTYSDKAYLLPQDDKLKAYVDTWLDLRKADGTVGERFAAYLK